MQLQNGGGDKLARGLSRASFPPAGGNVSQERWDKMWETDDAKQSGGDSGSSETRDAVPLSGEAVESPKHETIRR